MTRAFPKFVQDQLNSPPRAGEGVHAWLFRVARQLHAHLPAGEIVGLLESRVANCGRHVSRNEIEDAVMNSISCAWQPHRNSTSTHSRWPSPDLQRIEDICAEGYGLADLWELSRIRIEDNEQHTEFVIDHLFPGNPLLCCGASTSVFDTRPRKAWRGELAGLQLIVPSPMSALVGKKKNPNPDESQLSAHTLDNTGPRRFLVVECDFAVFARDGKTETRFAPLIRRLDAGGFSVADMGGRCPPAPGEVWGADLRAPLRRQVDAGVVFRSRPIRGKSCKIFPLRRLARR
jgi:hypothetical protein